MPIAFQRVEKNDAVVVDNLQINVTVNAGDCVTVGIDEVFSTVLKVEDSGGSVYTKLADSHPFRTTEVWGCLSANASTWVKVTMVDSFVIFNVGIQIFTGVASFGNTGTNGTTGTANSVSATMQSSANYLVSYFGNNTDPGALSNKVGTFTVEKFVSNQASQYLTCGYRTGTLGSLSMSYDVANSNDWQGAAVELVAPSDGEGARQIQIGGSIQMHGDGGASQIRIGGGGMF